MTILVLSFLLSLLFALGGVGSAIALVPLLDMMGIDYQSAKAIGLIVTVSAMLSATLTNMNAKTIDYSLALPLLLSSSLFSILGVYVSSYVDMEKIKMLFFVVLIFSASIMLFFHKKSIVHSTKAIWLYLIGAVAGTISGMLGIGGGLIIMPFLIMLGFDAKKVALSIGLIITISASSALLTQMTLTTLEMDTILGISIAGMFGGLLGNYLLKKHLNSAHVKKIISIFLYLLAAKILLNIWQ